LYRISSNIPIPNSISYVSNVFLSSDVPSVSSVQAVLTRTQSEYGEVR
jgi:hypothetical protein